VTKFGNQACCWLIVGLYCAATHTILSTLQIKT